MNTTKTHFAIPTTRHGEATERSLCGRSSGRIVKVETIENHQNLGSLDQVTCSFCLRLIAAKRHLATSWAA